MDDELPQLEAELKRLRPVAPSREVLARLGRELGPARPEPAGGELAESVGRARVAHRPSPGWWLWAGALPAAAALTLLVAFVVRRGFPVASSPTAAAELPVAEPAAFQPVAAENVLYSARDEGLVTLDDGTTARRERLNYVDTITWKNPRTNASVRWSVPREEIRVVPVIFQ